MRSLKQLSVALGMALWLTGCSSAGDGDAVRLDLGSPDTNAALDSPGDPDVADPSPDGPDAVDAPADALPDLLPDAPPSFPNRPHNATCVAPPRLPPAATVELAPAFTQAFPDGSRLTAAVQLVQSPADGSHWFIALLGGQVLAFSSEPDDAQVTVALDLHDLLALPNSESGLFDFALHPDFAENGQAFAVYFAPGPSDTVVSRLARLTADEDGHFSADDLDVLLDIPDRSGIHTGDHVAFGPDGYLYYSVGDDYDMRHAQDTFDLHGKLLRLDVSEADPERETAYAVPPGNPFADGVQGAPEVFAYGLRNPWRFSIDPQSGDIYAGDVGHGSREEIDRVVRGGNYGWSLVEGALCRDQSRCDDPSLIPPVVDYPRTFGAAVSGGYIYRGSAIPSLVGRYVFADFASGNLMSFAAAEEHPTLRLDREGAFNIVSLARAADGELYAVRFDRGPNGGLFRLVPPPAPIAQVAFPRRLSDTGCVDRDDPSEPAPGVVPYVPRVELWSDGADKRRFLAIPDDSAIRVAADGDFELPMGTVLIKHFGYQGRWHETRLFVHHPDGWAGYSYAWNDEQSDAFLVNGSQEATLPNGVRWTYPSRSQCLRCHTDAAGGSLGLEAIQLDWAASPRSGAVPVQQLEWLVAHDYFDASITSTADLLNGQDPLPDVYGTAEVGERARAYLHGNCSICHRAGGPGGGPMDLRFQLSLAETGTCDQAPLFPLDDDPVPDADERLLDPGWAAASHLYIRPSRPDGWRMPPLATRYVDQAGLAVLRQWIDSLSACPTE